MNTARVALIGLPLSRPAVGEVVVWRLRLSADASQIRAWREALPRIEQERAARFHHLADAERFILGRIAVRRILGQRLGVPPAQVELTADPAGKLHLNHPGPRWEFNLSHSGRYILVGVAWARAVGVDVELRRPDFPAEIASRFFAPEEIADLHAVPPSEQQAVFYALWTRKEATLKARGLGLGFPLADFAVSSLSGQPPRLLRWADEVSPELTWRLWSLDLDADHAGALVVRHDPMEPTVRLTSFDGLPT